MLLKENMRIKIVPEEIDSTFETLISKIDDDAIYFNLENNVITEGAVFDAYAFSDEGILFFSAKINSVQDNVAKISKEIKAELLQRRQYARIKIDDDVKIKEECTGNEIEGWMIDISVGGLKMHLKQPIDISKKYILNIVLDNNDMELAFKPISFVKDMENLYTLSARFDNIQNTDKITLVQYCYKKQAEKVEE